MLLYLCHYCFCHGKYDEAILSYLLSGYDGPMETMKTLWKAGKNFDLDTMALEEKILIMLAFERTGMEETEPIFESYRRKYGKKMLLAAYLNLMSYQYFVKGMDVQKPVFDEIERRMNASESVDPACRLAYLRYRTECGEASEKQLILMSQILQECGDKHMCFGFFGKVPGVSDAYPSAYGPQHHRVPHRSKGNRDADVHAGKSGRRHFRGAYGNAA